MTRDCCLDCNKRYIGCHSECEDYQNYKKVLETIKRNRKRIKDNENIQYKRRKRRK